MGQSLHDPALGSIYRDLLALDLSPDLLDARTLKVFDDKLDYTGQVGGVPGNENDVVVRTKLLFNTSINPFDQVGFCQIRSSYFLYD